MLLREMSVKRLIIDRSEPNRSPLGSFRGHELIRGPARTYRGYLVRENPGCSYTQAALSPNVEDERP